ncbi:hypothetical protein EV360DRAFT_69968 [Lentinula raphanica]|nr:hypothetical protein EV360DRAFT_69968 [Lentinula raphanica]
MAFVAGTVSTTLAAPLLATHSGSMVFVDAPESDPLLFESATRLPSSFSDSDAKTEVDIVWQDDPRKFKQDLEQGPQAKVVSITVPVPEPVEVETLAFLEKIPMKDDFLVVEAGQHSSEAEALPTPTIETALRFARPEVSASSNPDGYDSLRQRPRSNLSRRFIHSVPQSSNSQTETEPQDGHRRQLDMARETNTRAQVDIDNAQMEIDRIARHVSDIDPPSPQQTSTSRNPIAFTNVQGSHAGARESSRGLTLSAAAAQWRSQGVQDADVILKIAFVAGTVSSTTLAAPLLATQPESMSATRAPPSFSEINAKTEVDIVWQGKSRKHLVFGLINAYVEQDLSEDLKPRSFPLRFRFLNLLRSKLVTVDRVFSSTEARFSGDFNEDFLVGEAENPPAGCRHSSETEVLSAPTIETAFSPLSRPNVLASSTSDPRLSLSGPSVSSGLASLRPRDENGSPKGTVPSRRESAQQIPPNCEHPQENQQNQAPSEQQFQQNQATRQQSSQDPGTPRQLESQHEPGTPQQSSSHLPLSNGDP